MAIPKARPKAFAPRGLVDAFDATAKFPGACQSLQNLVFDQSNPELTVPRPGVAQAYALQAMGIAGAGFISVFIVLGTRIYGMVASSSVPGHDVPFAVEMSTGLLVAITGAVAGNTPTSPATSGDWTPPTMANIGSQIIVTHPGFSGVGANFFGVLDLTNPAAPVWSSANLATNPLPAVPTAVANFNNRAYYAYLNRVAYSDNLAPTVRTNASQFLVLGDNTNIVALAGLPLQTTSSGVTNALTAFKASQIWQVTGDTSLGNLAENWISLNIGTTAPRTIAQCPAGSYFLSTAGGPYLVDLLGAVRPVVNNLVGTDSDPDVQVPFQNAQTPSRWAGAYIASIFRVSGPTVLLGAATVNDYWFDEHRRRWNGPHTFQYDCAAPNGNAFLLSSALVPGVLMTSQTGPSLTATYVDMGSAYLCQLLTSTFPKDGDMYQKQVVESEIELGGYPVGATYTIRAQDAAGASLGDTVTINVPGSSGAVWGAFVWGAALWTSGLSRAPKTYAVPWTAPLVFEKMQLSVTVTAGPNVQIGAFAARFQQTGYMTQQAGA